MSVVAPHLVERLPFLFPLYRDGPHRPWVVRTGVLLYSGARPRRLNGRVSTRRALRLVPQLRTEGLHSSALYADAWTNDGRLTIANVRGAADAGAVVLNYAEVTAVRDGGADVLVDGQTVARAARGWSSTRPAPGSTGSAGSRIRTPPRSVRLSKGVHLIVDGGEDWGAAVTIPHDKVRVSFAIPWEGKLLLGTTDTLHEGEPEDGRVTDEDVRTILDEAGEAIARPRPRARLLLGAPRPARRARRDGERAARDGLHARPDRHAQRRRREADHVPPDRARRARAARRPQPRSQPAAAAGRDRARADPVAAGARRRRPARTCCISTARSRPRCSRRRSTIRRCSSRSSPAAPISAPRRSTRESASGRAPTRTCCAAARRRGSRGSD